MVNETDLSSNGRVEGFCKKKDIKIGDLLQNPLVVGSNPTGRIFSPLIMHLLITNVGFLTL